MTPDDARPGPQDAGEPEERVRRLLGQLGAERPELPPEVASRLEDTLAGLVRARAGATPRPASDADRRWGRILLVAAAAVIAIGAGGVTVASLQDRPGQSAGAGDAAAQRPSRLPVVRPGHVAGDVLALLGHGSHPAAPARSGPAPSADCAAPAGVPPRRVRAVLYGESPASLVLGPVHGSARRVEIWSCSGRTTLARARIPAR